MALLVGDRHEQRAAQAGLEVLLRQARQPQRAHVRVEHRLDGDRAVVQARAAGQLGGVVLGVVRGVLRRHRHAVHVLRAHRVARDRRDQRGVDTAGQADQDRLEAVLRDVRPQAHDQRRVDLLVVVQTVRVAARELRLVRRDRLLREDHPVDAQAVVHHARGGVRRRRRQVQVQDHAALGELRGPRHDLAVLVDDDRVAVEDQLVLAADHGEVRRGAAGLLGPLADQLQTRVVLVALVGGGVDRDQQARPRRTGGGDAAAVLPEVLADGEGDVHAVDAQDRHAVAGHEVAELVEDAVVRQVVLGEVQDHLAAVQHRPRVLRSAGRLAVLRLRGLAAVEIADDDRQLTEALVGQAGGETLQRRAGGLHEGRPEGQVLDGIPGQRHLRERHEMRSLLGGVPGPADDRLGVLGEVADARVDLVQGET